MLGGGTHAVFYLDLYAICNEKVVTLAVSEAQFQETLWPLASYL
jgi:hypothetical protein